MAAGSIIIDLLMRTGSFVTDTDRASKRLKQFEREAKDAGAAIGAALATAATATVALLQQSVNAMDDISKAAQRSGTTTEEFSKLSYAAGLADVAMTDLQTSLGRLTKAQAEALDPASQQAKIFKALGIEVTDAAGNLRSSTDVFKDFADVFEEQKGSPEIIAAGLNIFGRSFQNLIPLLKDGSSGLKDAADEAAAFGQVISTEAGANAEEFNDNLSRMKLFVTGVANAVAADLLPDLVGLQEGFLDGARDGDKLQSVAEDVANVFRVLGGAIEAVSVPLGWIDDRIQGTTMALQGLAEVAKGVIGLNWDQITRGVVLTGQNTGKALGLPDFLDPLGRGGKKSSGAGADMISAGAGGGLGLFASSAAEKAAQQRAKLIRDSAFGPSAKKGSSGGKSDAEKEADKLAAAYKKTNEQLEEQIALNGNNSAMAKLAFELQSGELSKLSDAQKQDLTDKQAKVDLLELERAAQKEVNQQSEDYASAVAGQAKAFKDHAADLQFELDLLGKSNKERQREIELRYLGAGATEAQREAIGSLSDRLYEEGEAMQRSIDLQDDFRDSFSDAAKDLIRGSSSAKEALMDFLDSINDRLAKMVADGWADKLFGKQGENGGGAAGGWLSSLAGAFGGSGGTSSGASQGGGWSDWIGTIVGAFSGAKASGGDILGNRSYLVGEDGPEMFVPRTAGRVYTAAQTQAITAGGGGRGLTQINNFTQQGRMDRRSEQKIAADVGRKANAAISRGIG
ncbi:hypothetical protein HEP73_02180 [Xanthomonas sp. GW]|uniref:hypothetical protein n=1 Tax=Xanthomonas sp. GW TaxID=2724121 RepID=UPI00163A50DD|nr:hypothetical protein [Xanthomonas sp. GW]QNH21266.1 hypothetical protein HEP73_02180 [Xanthomonas sp. GW]